MSAKPRDLDPSREMTVLAWRRTILRGVVIAVVAARLFSAQFGAVVVVIALVVVAAGVWLIFAASRQFSDVRSDSGRPSASVAHALHHPTVRLAVTVSGALVLALASLWWVWSG